MNLERLILEVLSTAHPRMLTENVLWSEVRLDAPGTSLTDLRRSADELERKSQVVVVKTDDNKRLKITPDGLARLAE